MNQATARPRNPRVAVIGAGMSGICAAAKLGFAGVEDVTVFEKSDRVGGTWRENTYPGLFCDVPSRNYSYTFAPNPDWTRLFSPGPEIYAYIDRVVDDLGLRSKIAFGVEIEEISWTDAGRWQVRTAAGDREEFDFVISAAGILHHPRVPEIPGLERFQGASFHSARWDHSVPLDGRRIAVIGGGSTGVQITNALAPRCQLLAFQRTPQWVLPIVNPRYPKLLRRALRRFPSLNRAWNRFGYRLYEEGMDHVLTPVVLKPGLQRRLVTLACKANLRRVRDPQLRRRLTPNDQPACKRLIAAAGYYRSFNEHGAQLIDAAIEEVTENGIRTADGVEHEVDVIVLATGFHAHRYIQPVEIVAPDGTRLSELWKDGPLAYRTVALPEFPNLFLLLGPHSPVGNQSLFTVAETQVDYVVQWIEAWRGGEFDAAAPSREACDAFNEGLQGAFGDTVWMTGCESWYFGTYGLPVLWPWTGADHRKLLAEPRRDEWRLTSRSSHS